MKLRAWVLASRPKTLSAAAAPVIVGTALAYRDRAGEISWLYAVLALAGAALIQIATNFINDALDFKKGADTAERLGPRRVTQAGLLEADTVMRGAYLCLFLAALCGIPLVVVGGWPLLVIGLCSIAAAYLYTGGPWPLAYHGLGELFVMVFFGIVAVGGTYFVLSRAYGRDALVGGLAMGSLSVVILAINNLRDLAGDRLVNKRTIAVRIGDQGARGEVVLFAILPFALTTWLGILGPLLLLPLAIVLVGRVYRSSGAQLNGCLALAGALQWAFAVAFVVDALFGSGARR